MKKLILLTLIISGCGNTGSEPKAEVGGKYIDYFYVDTLNPFAATKHWTFTIIDIKGDYAKYVMGNDTASTKIESLMWKAKRIN